MKQIKHLSPSSISTWLNNTREFYLRYLSDNRPDKEPQTQPMSVGSAFDSEVKAELRHIIYNDDRAMVYDQYFTDSVEVQNRDWARTAGRRCFESYRESGALNDLVIEMAKAKEGPRFEFYVSNTDKENDQVKIEDDKRISKTYAGGVILLGKPDAWYISSTGNHIILDWKVNGYCAKRSVPPEKGYIIVRGGKLMPGMTKHMQGNGSPHRDTILLNRNGTLIDCSYKMEEKNVDWARQLAIYSWLCGEGVGSDLIGSIDQLVVSDVGYIRVAEHRCVIGSIFQFELFSLCQRIWTDATDGHFFKDVSLAESQERCNQLDGVKDVLNSPMVRAMYGR